MDRAYRRRISQSLLPQRRRVKREQHRVLSRDCVLLAAISQELTARGNRTSSALPPSGYEKKQDALDEKLRGQRRRNRQRNSQQPKRQRKDKTENSEAVQSKEEPMEVHYDRTGSMLFVREYRDDCRCDREWRQITAQRRAEAGRQRCQRENQHNSRNHSQHKIPHRTAAAIQYERSGGKKQPRDIETRQSQRETGNQIQRRPIESERGK